MDVTNYFSFVSADILHCIYLVWQNFIPKYFNLYHKYMKWVTAHRTRYCYDTTCAVGLTAQQALKCTGSKPLSHQVQTSKSRASGKYHPMSITKLFWKDTYHTLEIHDKKLSHAVFC